MEKTKCKICGKRHWGIICGPDAVGVPSSPPPKPLTPTAVAVIEVPAPAKPPFDRAAYQREYMRTYMPKWRAAKRDKRP